VDYHRLVWIFPVALVLDLMISCTLLHYFRVVPATSQLVGFRLCGGMPWSIIHFENWLNIVLIGSAPILSRDNPQASKISLQYLVLHGDDLM
jgi:hypothetical protein